MTTSDLLLNLTAPLVFQAGYNATIVTLGADLLGAAAGAIGVFTFLQRQSLTSDAAAHATLPGIAGAFIITALLIGDGQHIAILLLGAYLSSLAGLLTVNWIIRHTRLNEDAAIGYTISVFFALGLVLLTVIQTMSDSGQAGLKSYLLGAAAGMTRNEVEVIGAIALAVCLIVLVLKRSYVHIAFDPLHASGLGIAVNLLKNSITFLLVTVIVIGLKIVGVILIIAMVIIPPATAWLWANRVNQMLIISIIVSVSACHFGVALSSALSRIPTGAAIVTIAFLMFLFSLMVAPKRGVIANLLVRRNLRTVGRNQTKATFKGE